MAYAEDEITLTRQSIPLARPEVHPSVGQYDGEDEATIKATIAAGEAHRWLVQLELESEQIVPLYRLGLARDAVVWRDGMPDWRPLLIMRELRQVLAAHSARVSKSARLRLSSLGALQSRQSSPADETPPPVTTKKPKSVPPPPPSARAKESARDDAPLEPRMVLAPREAPRETEFKSDAGLALLMELNHPRPRPRRIEVKHVDVSPPAIAPATPLQFEAQALPPPSQRVVVPFPQPRGPGVFGVVAPALLAIVLTTLFFWFGPVKTAREAAEQAERAIWLMSPRREPKPATPAASSTAAASQPPLEAAAVIPVMSFADLAAPATESGSRGRSRTEAPAESKPASAKATEAPRPERAPAPRAPSGEPDRRAIASALAAAGGRTASCNEGGSGTARAVVTFGSSGAVRSVAFESALPQGVNRSCVYSALSRARIPPFTGDAVTVRKTLRF